MRNILQANKITFSVEQKVRTSRYRMSKQTQAMIKESVDKAVSESLSEIRIQTQIELIERLQKIISSINDVVTLDDFYCVLDGMKRNLVRKSVEEEDYESRGID